MKIQLFARLLLLLVTAFSPLVINAQNERSSASFQFSCVTWEKLTMQELFYRERKEFIPLELFRGKRSALYPLKGKGDFELYTLAVNEEDEQYYKLVGKALLPKATDRALFIISEKETRDGLPLTISGVDDSLKAFPPGSFRFINFTPVRLKVEFGNSSKFIEPTAMTLMKSKLEKGIGLVSFYIKTRKGEVIYENRLFAQADGREMVFIAPPSKPDGRLTVKFLSHIAR